jgi:hypothetical protein
MPPAPRAGFVTRFVTRPQGLPFRRPFDTTTTGMESALLAFALLTLTTTAAITGTTPACGATTRRARRRRN